MDLIPGLFEVDPDLDELLAESEVATDSDNGDNSGGSDETNDNWESSDSGDSDGIAFDDSLVNLA